MQFSCHVLLFPYPSLPTYNVELWIYYPWVDKHFYSILAQIFFSLLHEHFLVLWLCLNFLGGSVLLTPTPIKYLSWSIPYLYLTSIFTCAVLSTFMARRPNLRLQMVSLTSDRDGETQTCGKKTTFEKYTVKLKDQNITKYTYK